MCVRVAPDPLSIVMETEDLTPQERSRQPWGFFILGLIIGALTLGLFLTHQSQIICGPEIVPPDGIDLSTFWEAWNHVEKEYMEASDLDRERMVYGAISGMIESVGDPYTVFFDPQESLKFQEDLSGEIEGVGMEVGLRQGIITVVAPIKDTPAEKAGLQPGDQIIKIDDMSTYDMGVDEAVQLIRGVKGTEVVLTIRRPDVFDEREFPLIRDVIQIPSVAWELIDGSIAHLEIYHFHQGLVQNFQEVAAEIIKSPAQGIILDLRNNPGGYLDVAIDVAGWFLPMGNLVAIEEFGSGERQEFRSRGNAKLAPYPTLILINQGSASGSEILAGALRDNRNLRIIGEQSFGKGSVQQTFNLRDGSMVKITIAKWLTPSGHLIEGVGLEPDITVELNLEEYLEKGEDKQLDKAVELLKEIIN